MTRCTCGGPDAVGWHAYRCEKSRRHRSEQMELGKAPEPPDPRMQFRE